MNHRLPLIQKSLTDLRRHTPEAFLEAREKHTAFLVTDRGQAAGVIVDPESWDMLNRRLDLLEKIALGMQDVAEGRLTPHENVKAEFTKWL
ncbi:MAG: type II toxin-antitoxin system Phd/YefM family antitoxin [Holophaga sp.]|nr:type II toxin-antitoxin system Phd/YefM family antitoxin [Holophaga sp.]